MARQTRPLTPAEAVRQGRKLIAERRRQALAAAQPEPISGPIFQPDPPPAGGEGGAEAAIGMPISEQDQRLEVVPNCRKMPGGSLATAAPSVAPRVIPGHDKTGENYSDPIPDAPNADPTLIFAATIVGPEINEHPDGTWPLTDLRTGQFRFACTADDVPRNQHRFCGRRTFVGPRNLDASWCDEHLARVWGTGTVSERNAHHVTQDVRRFG